ncbi:hypothetical protein HJG54_10355 [Leptolyngbya sp. NK1-12]|uniref:FHA domain containing protein n=1 Tax=Leptolyngbya sp. NK1-12 TaxID=2547451 RepID=A0AA96WBB3_9CYAN|nr:hypothetical protein [Leptolyngbya sp. NK1-12]WNZ23212.1 hypothetical protein HJG54_10355 [Leptolyngbya sp. NK1-12]
MKPTRTRLTEVSPPFAIQNLKQDLEIYQPQVKILSPRPNQVLEDTEVEVRLQVNDLTLFKDEALELGPYLQVLLDNQPYTQVFDTSEPLKLENLTPGTHTLRVFAVRPWHESFKNEGAFALTTFHVFTQTPENNPDPKKPLLTYNYPQDTYGAEPVLLDFYLTNAPLHLVAREDTQDAIPDWEIRCTINGESFTFDRWEPIYLKGLKPGKNWVQLELLDENGNPISNVFNNTVQVVTYEPGGSDTLAQLTRGELTADAARKIVNPNYVPPPPEPEIILEPDVETDLTEPEPESMPPELLAPESATEPTAPIEPTEPEAETAKESPIQPEPESDIEAPAASESLPESLPESVTVPSLELIPQPTEAPESSSPALPPLKVVPEPAANPNFMPPSLKLVPQPVPSSGADGTEALERPSFRTPARRPAKIPIQTPAEPEPSPALEHESATPDSLQERLEAVEEKVEELTNSSVQPLPTQLEMPTPAIKVKPSPVQSVPAPLAEPQLETSLDPLILSEPIMAPVVPAAEIDPGQTQAPVVPDLFSALDRVKGFFEGLRKQPSSTKLPLLSPLSEDLELPNSDSEARPLVPTEDGLSDPQ